MPSYVKRILGLGGGVCVLAVVVRFLLIPEGFGSFGFYRDNAPKEEAEREPVYQGKKVCGKCHNTQLLQHDKDVHFRVECEDCHGAGLEHSKAREGGEQPNVGYIFRELIQANCLACHRPLIARPKLFPTVSVKDHYEMVGVADMGIPCQGCHDPHQPLFLQQPSYEARIHPLIHPCTDCHDDTYNETQPLPPGHIVTFKCADCHADLAKDAKTKSHKSFDCRICHQFHRDSEFSGRIYKNGDPRFCLMCHQNRPFKMRDKIPLINSLAEHLEEVASDETDKQKRCADCHLEGAIHKLQKTPGK